MCSSYDPSSCRSYNCSCNGYLATAAVDVIVGAQHKGGSSLADVYTERVQAVTAVKGLSGNVFKLVQVSLHTLSIEVCPVYHCLSCRTLLPAYPEALVVEDAQKVPKEWATQLLRCSSASLAVLWA